MMDITPTTEDRNDDAAEQRRRRFVWLSELGLVAAAALVFLLFLTALIGVYFPQGSALVGEQDDQWFADFSYDDSVELQVDAGSGEARQVFAGKLVSLRRRVQRRGGNSLAWQDAKLGDKFNENDAVQTFSRSTALLAVSDESYLTVGENSLIVFDRKEADPFVQAEQSVLVMVAGELSGAISAEGDSRLQFSVNLPNSDVTLQSDAAGGEVDFLITVNEDQSTTLNLSSGIAEVVGKAGQRRKISAQESITVDATGTQLRVSKMPPAPGAIGPRNDTVVRYRNVPEDVEFEWQSVANADRYHIVVARDPEFSDLLVDDDVVGTAFTHGALGPGKYYWHVRSRAGWAQSSRSGTHRLRVVQDLEAPLLQLDEPAETVAAGPWRLSGRTDPDAAVFIDGLQVNNRAGQIDQEIALKHGANIITVKAVDSVGNLSYASLAIKAK